MPREIPRGVAYLKRVWSEGFPGGAASFSATIVRIDTEQRKAGPAWDADLVVCADRKDEGVLRRAHVRGAPPPAVPSP